MRYYATLTIVSLVMVSCTQSAVNRHNTRDIFVISKSVHSEQTKLCTMNVPLIKSSRVFGKKVSFLQILNPKEQKNSSDLVFVYNGSVISGLDSWVKVIRKIELLDEKSVLILGPTEILTRGRSLMTPNVWGSCFDFSRKIEEISKKRGFKVAFLLQ
jgi:hypothetical protein